MLLTVHIKNQSIFFISEAQCHLFPSNCAAEANSFSRRAAKIGQYRKCFAPSKGASQRAQAGKGQQFF